MHKFLLSVVGVCVLCGPVWAQRELVTGSTGAARVAASQVSSSAGSLGGAVKKTFAQAQLASHINAFQSSVFYVRARKSDKAFSGSVFEVEIDGQKEIYGVIAAHSLARQPVDLLTAQATDYTVHRNFLLHMMDKDGHPHQLLGEVVWLSSPLMWDVALVKFSDEEAKLFKPFTLTTQLPARGEQVQTRGFVRDLSVYIPNRQVVAFSPLSVRTTMPIARENRTGLCGSPVFRQRPYVEGEEPVYEMLGMHTGSAWEEGGLEEEDIGYFTPGSFLRDFVLDYRTQGEVNFPVRLKGTDMFSLKSNEHIKSMILFDDEKRRIGWYTFEEKFSYRKMESLVDTFGPHYIEFTIEGMEWSHVNPDFWEFDPRVRRVTYDLKTRSTVWPNL